MGTQSISGLNVILSQVEGEDKAPERGIEWGLGSRGGGESTLSAVGVFGSLWEVACGKTLTLATVVGGMPTLGGRDKGSHQREIVVAQSRVMAEVTE